MTYQEQLNHPKWKKKAEGIKADAGRCKVCGSTKDLQVHHKQYRADLKAWEYKDEELVCLCKKCHETLHLIAGNEFLPTKDSEFLQFIYDRMLEKRENKLSLYMVWLRNKIKWQIYEERKGKLKCFSSKDYEREVRLILEQEEI